MHRPRPWAVFGALLLAGTAGGQVVVYTDEAAFLAAVGTPAVTLTFDADAIGAIAGSEYAGFVFTGLAGGAGAQISVAPADFFAATPYLNVGERPFQSGDGNEDSLRVDIAGAYAAIGFRVVDGALPAGAEQIVFYDAALAPLHTWAAGDGASAFVGLVATVPIRRVEIFEAANDGDDVGYDSFMLAQPLAVPEPSTLALAAGGLAGLAFAARRRRA